MNHLLIEMADIKKSRQWLDKTGLKDSREALIMAAEEQAPSPRSMEAGVYHTRQDPTQVQAVMQVQAVICWAVPETIQREIAKQETIKPVLFEIPKVKIQDHCKILKPHVSVYHTKTTNLFPDFIKTL